MFSNINLHTEYIDDNVYLLHFSYNGNLIHKELFNGHILKSEDLKAKFIFNLFNKEVADEK